MTSPSLVALAATVALMYLAGSRVFDDARLGVVAVAAFVSAPLLWAGGVSLTPLAFVAGWLAACARFEGSVALAAIGGGCLGLGLYASTAAVVMMPLYLVLTVGVVAVVRPGHPRWLGFLIAAFALTAAPLGMWLIQHPERYRAVVSAYHLYDADRFNLRQGLREMTSWVGLTARTEVYYDYFNPAFLFLNSRVLLPPMVVLIPVGLYQIAVDETSPISRLCFAGFLAAPFAASLTAQPPVPARMLFATPFAAMLATYGVKRMVNWYRVSRGARSRQPVHS